MTDACQRTNTHPKTLRRHHQHVICPNCFTDTLDDARFCTGCGASLADVRSGAGPATTESLRTEAVPAVNTPAVVAPRADDDLTGTEAVPVVTNADGPSTQVNPGVAAPRPAGASAWDQPDGGAATAVHDLAAPDPPRSAPRPLPAPAPSTIWSSPNPRASSAPAERTPVRSGRWARILAGLVSLWLPISALIYVVVDQGDLLGRSALEFLAIITPTRLSWGVWSSTHSQLAWTIPLRAMSLLAAFGALVILAAWMARSRQAMRVGLLATGLVVTMFGVVQLLWVAVGLDLLGGLTTGQELRQVYVPAGVSMAVGVLLVALAPAAGRTRT